MQCYAILFSSRISIKSIIKQRSVSRRNLGRLRKEYDEYGNVPKFCQVYRRLKHFFQKKLYI